MKSSTIYFSDNFFSSGLTDIYNEQKEKVGSLDLKSAFSSTVDVIDLTGTVLLKGKFPFFSNKWMVLDDSNELGVLKQKLSFFSKRFEYTAYHRGVYEIESDAFSKEYRMVDDNKQEIAVFEKISGFFQSPAFRLINYSSNLSNEELIAVVMGVNAITKRNQSAAQ
ncbi:hypothetical protein [Bacillus sp. FJAT-47783]|uniref:hypothetical protein n=1 Tax=Bacillus sp. FJAT-47783 TaxID=2922712 RepID=UPI001FAC7928|nr:hypothetical protein [Bacillus sp. FJAT-47783]